MISGQGVQRSVGVRLAQTSGGLTLAGALSSHALAPNPPMTALEQVISERNVLWSQNSQLWKLIEKYRLVHNRLLEESERVRSERDTFKARLTSLGENPDQILKEQEASKGSHSGNTHDQPKVATPKDPRLAMIKNQSVDLAPSPNNPAHPIIPVRVESLRPPPIPPTSRLNTKSYYGPQTSNSTPALSPLPPTISPPPTSAQSYKYKTVTLSSSVFKPPRLFPNIPLTSSRDLSQPNRPKSLPSQGADSLQPPALSQESTIPLPEEALRYMARMGEPPAQSPPVSSFKSKLSEVRSEPLSQVSVLETKGNTTKTNGAMWGVLIADGSVNDDVTGSWLSDGEFEEDKPSSRGMEDFQVPPTLLPSVAASIYSLSIVPDVRSEYSFSL